MSKREEMGRCLPCREEENVLHIPLKCMETQRCKENLLMVKNSEELAYKQ
jgi:hypothetical protein